LRYTNCHLLCTPSLNAHDCLVPMPCTKGVLSVDNTLDDEVIAVVQKAPENEGEDEDEDKAPMIFNKVALESIQNNSSFALGLRD
jgi:hypothetical protein